MVQGMLMSHDAPSMSSDLPVIILLLGATIVPWLVWVSASGRNRPDAGDREPERPPSTAPVSRTLQEAPDGSFRSSGLLQIRPDGVGLDWRDEQALVLTTPSLSVTTGTDTRASH